MKILIRNFTVTCLTIIFLIGQVGCAAKTRPLRLTNELRAQLGTIAVAPARFIPEQELRTPAKGRLSGAGRGAAAGFTETERLGLLVPSSGGVEGALIAAGVVAIIATATVIGGVYGAVAAPSKATVEEAEAVLKKARAAVEVQQALGEHIVAYGRAHTHFTFKLLLDQGPSAVNEQVDYRPLAGDGVDTVLEVNVLKFGFQGDYSVNPPVHVSMTVQIRLIRAADTTKLFERTFDYSSKNHKFTEWAAHDAQLFREVVARTYQEAAKEIVGELF